MNRRILYVLICIMLVFVSTGCGGASTSEEPAAPASSAPAASGADSAPADPASISATLNYFEPHYSDPNSRIAIDKSIALFNEEYPNIKVIVESVPMAERTAKFVAAQAAGKGADICCIGAGGDYIAFSQEGYLVDLNQFVKPDYWDQFLDTFTEFGKVNGAMYGIPYYSGNYAVMYNKQHYADAGVTPPETWSEFKEAMKKLTRDTDNDGQIDRYGLALSTQREVAPRLLTMLCWSNGGEILSADNKPVINSQTNVEALEYISSFVKEGLVPPGVANADPTVEEQQFSAGLVSTMFEGNWGIARILQSNPAMEKDLGFYPLPAPEGKVAQSLSTIAYFSISTDSKQQDKAFLFLDYMTKTDVQLSFVDSGGFLPTTTEAFGARMEDKFYGSFCRSMPDARLLPVYKNDGEVQDLMRLAMQSAFLGSSSAKEALDVAQKTFEGLIN